EKSLTLDADAIILDLEDSVAPADKAPSRAAVVAALSRKRHCLAYVRVNAPATSYCYADLVATVQKGLDGIVVPKIESAADLLASRAAGMENPIDSPWFHFKEAAAFARALERSRRGGFQGRCCVHPDQIAPVNDAYRPSAEELAAAERIVAAFAEAEKQGAAAIQVDGQMIDYPIVHRAQALLDAVRQIKGK